MEVAPYYQIKPTLQDFISISESKRILSHAVKTIDDDIYEAPYLEGIFILQQVISANPQLKYFIPNSPDIHSLYQNLKPEERFLTSTGTIVLRRDRNGYADERVTDPNGKKLKLPQTSIAEHGINWIAKSNNSVTIIEPNKLKPYTEIDAVTDAAMYRVGNYDVERGVVTKFNLLDKPIKDYNNAIVWVNPNLLLVPLGRGDWYFDLREGLFYPLLECYAEDPLYVGYYSTCSCWRFPLGSISS